MYVGVGSTKFDEMVSDGRMPKPKKVDGQLIWDMRQLYVHTPEPPAPPTPLPRRPEVSVIGFGDYVKIGYSTAFPYRLRAIQGNVPVPLTIYGRFVGRQTQERVLHRRFAAHRLNGEWFRFEGALADWIKEGCPYP